MAESAIQLDIVFHYPPELTQLLIQTIPLLCPGKRDVLMFFKGSGVARSMRADLEAQVTKDRDSINKYEIVRIVLERVNATGESALRERREILRRVTEFDDFSTCWPNDVGKLWKECSTSCLPYMLMNQILHVLHPSTGLPNHSHLL